MRTHKRQALRRGCAAVAISGVMATGLVGCAEEEPATTPADDTMVEDSGDSGDPEGEDDNDAVDVAAISDEGAGSDGVYDGTYDSAFLEEVNSFEGERVTVSAAVNEVISDQAFTIGGIDNADVEPLLVLHANPLDFLEQGTTVLVTGVVHKSYTLAAAEDQLGTQLDEVELSEWGEQPYIETDTVGELAAS